jgi:hypothetical protein
LPSFSFVCPPSDERRDRNSTEEPESPREDASFSECLLLGQAEQVLDEALRLVVNREILFVGTDVVLAPPP